MTLRDVVEQWMCYQPASTSTWEDAHGWLDVFFTHGDLSVAVVGKARGVLTEARKLMAPAPEDVFLEEAPDAVVIIWKLYGGRYVYAYVSRNGVVCSTTTTVAIQEAT